MRIWVFYMPWKETTRSHYRHLNKSKTCTPNQLSLLRAYCIVLGKIRKSSMNSSVKFCLFFFTVMLFSGCATKPYDYSAFQQSKPRSILVIPPKNNSMEVNAPYIYLSTI